MKKKAMIKVLAAAQDWECLHGVLDQLRRNGMRIADGKGSLRKNDIVLAVLSEQFYADEGLKAQLFNQLAVGADTILPLKLGDCPIPEDIMNLLFSRNIIMASGRNDEQLAERILSAIPEKKNPLPVILAVAAAVLLVLGGIFLWLSMREPEPEPVSVIEEEEPIPNPWGITEEELAKIQDVVIVGDKFAYYTSDDFYEDGYWPDIYDFAYESWEDDASHWYSTEDGQEYALTRYEDLRFLELMPNLKMLRMVLVDVDSDMLPDLSGSKQLSDVSIHNCSISDVNWLAGSSVSWLRIYGTEIADYSPLSQCASLRSATIDAQGHSMGDVSRFAPPNLLDLYISNLQPGEVDLSALAGCTKMSWLCLDTLQLADLSFLQDMQSLRTLELSNLPQLRDISAISTLGVLKELRIRQCDMVTNYTPISGCSMLELINIERNQWIAMDSAFLNGLSKLNDIGLYGLNLNNMDFLATLNQKHGINLGFCGDIQDYSGLAAVDRYQFIHVNPRSINNGSFGDFSLVRPYLQEATISEMELYNCTNVDLAELPTVNTRLTITRGDLENLEGLYSEYLNRLELRDMQYLRSLDGIEALPKLSKSTLELSIAGCPRLIDYSALNGANLSALHLIGTYTIPDFSDFRVRGLRLESIEDLEDLSCLETLDKSQKYHFEFLGLDALKDLSILRDFKGYSLYVPPQVADQAEELVADGNFISWEVRYPDSGWSPMNEEVTLLSMEELETLPKAVLRRVSRLWIVGDEIIDPNRYEVWEEWENDHPIPVIYDRETGQTRKVNTGSIADFSALSELTQLWELRLFDQPLADLAGIQNLTNLRYFEAKFCPNLTDASALYAQQNLEEISLQYSGVDSIQGVQNLPNLQRLNVNDTQVSDLSPLTDCDFTYATENDGFVLVVGNSAVEDFAPLAAIPVFRELNICGYPAESWMTYVEQSQIKCIVGQMENDETLQRFVQQHPELEEAHIEDGYHLADLTPLLELGNLRYVHVWGDATVAGYSLDGVERGFDLDLD